MRNDFSVVSGLFLGVLQKLGWSDVAPNAGR